MKFKSIVTGLSTTSDSYKIQTMTNHYVASIFCTLYYSRNRRLLWQEKFLLFEEVCTFEFLLSESCQHIMSLTSQIILYKSIKRKGRVGYFFKPACLIRFRLLNLKARVCSFILSCMLNKVLKFHFYITDLTILKGRK